MTGFFSLQRVGLLAASLLAGIASTLYAQTFTTFDPPNSTSTVPNAINFAGQITGYYSLGDEIRTQSFLRQPDGTIVTFAVHAELGDNAFAMDINPFGQITGWYILGGPFVTGSFIRQADGTIITFSGHPQSAQNKHSAALEPAPRLSCSGDGSVALAINAFGQITGTESGLGCLGYLRQPNGNTLNFSLSTPSFISDTLPQAINLLGQITGYYSNENGYGGFLRQPRGTIIRFDVPNSTSTFPRAINLLGQITGYYEDANLVVHGFLRQPNGTIITFDPPGATYTQANSINLKGQIAGFYLDANNTYHGFVRQRRGTFATFEAPGAGTADFRGTFSQAISVSGQITGYYQDVNFVLHGFVRSAR